MSRYERGDVCLLRSPEDPDRWIIKRLVSRHPRPSKLHARPPIQSRLDQPRTCLSTGAAGKGKAVGLPNVSGARSSSRHRASHPRAELSHDGCTGARRRRAATAAAKAAKAAQLRPPPNHPALPVAHPILLIAPLTAHQRPPPPTDSLLSLSLSRARRWRSRATACGRRRKA